MPYNLTGYKVFIASPGGLEDERRAFAKEIEDYNKIEANDRNVLFHATGWEDTLAGMGRPQSIINKELIECDYFIMVLHDKWGSNPGKNKQDATSGTEEEYLLALECLKKKESPMKQVVCLFKAVPPNQLADPGPQLQKVIDFKRKIEAEKTLLYSNFSSLDEFRTLIRKNLAQWLRDDGSGSQTGYIFPQASPSGDSENFPDNDPEQMEINNETDESLVNAWKLAKDGKIVDAEIEFSKALINNPKEHQLLSYASFLMDIGQLEKALIMIERAVHLATANDNYPDEARAHTLKGIVLQTRDDLDGAKEMYKKSLEINEKLGRPEGMADQYGNLGNILQIRGDSNGAEEMYKKSLEINEKLGRPGGMADQYGNLGIVRQARGDLNGAKEMYEKSLEINEKLGRHKGMADQYGNLGIVLKARGNLDRAEDVQKKSLEINKKIGRLGGIAANYGNLGNILQIRGDLDGAEEMYKKSLEINEKIGRLQGMANQYGNLGNILQIKGDLNGAEEMYKKSLEINEKIGRLQGMVDQYGNLGILLQTKDDLDGAEEMYKKSLEINEKLGRLEGMAAVYGNLGLVLKSRGDLDGAQKMYEKTLEIAENSGFKSIAEKANRLLKDLLRVKD